MNKKTFAAFVGPSVAMMLLFIALPLALVFIQSFQVTKPVTERVEVETCTPGFAGQTCVTKIETRPVFDAAGNPRTETNFVGLGSYQKVLQLGAAGAAIAKASWADLMLIDFWKALRFTITFTLVTLPLVLGFGLAIALAVNNATKSLKGPVIFVSLLPFIITPVIGALSIRWLFIGDGILTAGIEWYLGRDVALFAQGWTIELMMLFYRVWHCLLYTSPSPRD